MSELLSALAASVSVSRYALLVPGALLEGVSASIVAGSLARVGIYDFWAAYAFLVAGKLIGDVGWYWIGYRLGNPFLAKHGKRFRLSDEDIGIAKDLFRRHHDAVLFFSKLTMGLGLSIVILFTAGLSRVNFFRYLLLNLLGEVLWTGALLAAGYYFGNIFLETSTGMERAAIIGSYALGFALLILAGRYARRHIVAARRERGAS